MSGLAPASEGTQPSDPAFAAAFAAAASAEDDTIPAVDTPPADTPPADTPPADTPPADTPPANTPPADTPPADTPPAPPSADEIVQGLADLLKNQPPAVTPPADTPPADPAIEKPLYEPAEIEVLADYEKNWPDVARAESLKRRAEYHDLMKYMFTEVEAYVRPLVEQLRTVGNNLHVGELKELVPDYSVDLEESVATWVDTQPNYLQAGMKQVMQSGTPDEVADLIGRYRAATGAAPPAPAPPPAPVPAPAKPARTELSSAAKQAAESLAPVSSERTQPPAEEDSGDFVSAFARYAAETVPK